MMEIKRALTSVGSARDAMTIPDDYKNQISLEHLTSSLNIFLLFYLFCSPKFPLIIILHEKGLVET